MPANWDGLGRKIVGFGKRHPLAARGRLALTMLATLLGGEHGTLRAQPGEPKVYERLSEWTAS
jgi:hypothetical protein